MLCGDRFVFFTYGSQQRERLIVVFSLLPFFSFVRISFFWLPRERTVARALFRCLDFTPGSIPTTRIFCVFSLVGVLLLCFLSFGVSGLWYCSLVRTTKQTPSGKAKSLAVFYWDSVVGTHLALSFSILLSSVFFVFSLSKSNVPMVSSECSARVWLPPFPPSFSSLSFCFAEAWCFQCAVRPPTKTTKPYKCRTSGISLTRFDRLGVLFRGYFAETPVISLKQTGVV